MAAGGVKLLSFFLLIINLLLYITVLVIAGWAINFGIKNTYHAASELTLPVQLFPIYFPTGNMATGFFITFSVIAGVVGVASSVAGIDNVLQWNEPSLMSAANFSVTAWSLTLLAMGLACKEMNIGRREASLRTLEALMLILSGTQLLCSAAIHAGVTSVSRKPTILEIL